MYVIRYHQNINNVHVQSSKCIMQLYILLDALTKSKLSWVC